ncbi:S-layer homology domain-containing protein [Butyricicoccus sp. Marseille-Q5471]|uniref:S-layer homology domain-containing protein n=1 Tax=Butyricicoccus sp. Marseille-Q5471 TaxID=3039493 RepID=UPI0024BCADCE|nr:S-layer homology domain-containing protein [Butyricicoccus sp. Marseille-Q5471]
MKVKRALSFVLAVVMLVVMVPSVGAAGVFQDTQGHWAESVIEKWSGYELIRGYNGRFQPDQSITRADMAVVIDRLLDYQTAGSNTFTDLPEDYYTDAVLRTARESVMQGYDGAIRPLDPITREEAVCVMARALKINAAGTSAGFADDAQISSWAMPSVASFAAKGYVGGKTGNRFDPQANITRAEVIQLLDNMISDYIVQSGTVASVGDGLVIVKAENVVLKGVTIKCGLILGGKAGEVTLDGGKTEGTVVKIGGSTLKTTGTATGGSTTGGSGGSGSSAPSAPDAYPLPKGQETSASLGVFDYDMTYAVTLTAQSGADIYYEIAEGADAAPTPTTASTKFETYQYGQIEIARPAASADGPVENTYNIKAIAVENGKTSTVSNWNYTVTSIPHHELKVSAPKDWNGKDVPNVTLIQDYDSDKMYLVEGENRAMVLDAGLFDVNDQAQLYERAREIVGPGKPIDLVIGHPHGDHVKMTHQFLCEENKALGAKVYVNQRGKEVLRDFVLKYGVESGTYQNQSEANAAYEAQISLLKNGDVYDLGGTKFDVIELPGHQVAGIMLFDTKTGNLFSTDQIGNNRAHVTDSFWMQFASLNNPYIFADPMDVYLSSLQIALERIESLGTVKRILTGHNDVVLDGQGSYLDNLMAATQRVVDEGKDSMTPTLRTMASLIETTRTVVVGDRLNDINWVGINVDLTNYLSDGYRDGNQDKLADLSNLSVHMPGESGNLLWDDPNFGINVNWKYPTDGTAPSRKTDLTFTATVGTSAATIEIVPTAAATKGTVTINGKAAPSGQAVTVELPAAENTFTVVCTAPNGTDTKTYTVKVNKDASVKAAAPVTYTDYDNYKDPFYPDTTGTYTVTQYMALFSDTEGATVKYTLDGTDPKTSNTAKVYDQTKFKAASGAGGADVAELIAIADDTGDSWDGAAKQTNVTLKAYAAKAGMDDSDVVTFQYTIDRMSKNAHKSRVLYEQDGMKVWQVIDYDSDKMYLIKGANKALLIDAGMAPSGAEDLYTYASTLADTSEVDLYISHGHPDHTTQIGDFVDADRTVYMNENDLAMAKLFINDKTVEDSDFTFIDEGFTFDLGGVELENYFVPGHTPGSMLLLDKTHNILYSSDALGCNRRSVADSLTLASNDVRVLLSSIRVFKDKMTALDAAGEIDLDAMQTWTGHDDYVISDLTGHLDTVIAAAQNIVDYGPDKAMRVSVRNTASSDGASFAGDRYANGGTGHFIVMNGKKATALGGQDYMTVSELANLKTTVAGETENRMVGLSSTHAFDGSAVGAQNALVAEVPVGTASVDVYPTAMSSGASVKVDGKALSGVKATVELHNGYREIPIEVTARDGSTKQTYTLTVRTAIDRMNPYATLYAGTHTETVSMDDGSTRTFTSYVPDGARESNAGVFVLPDQGEAAQTLAKWTALADSTDTEAIDADWSKQQEKFIVIGLDGLTYDNLAADIEYVNKVYAAASGRTMYCIHEAKNYMVGYGAGGTIAQMAAMDQTAVWAGLTTVGADAADDTWLAAHNTKMATSLNGYSDENSVIPKNTLPLPVWIINEGTTTDPDTLGYWKTADKITEDGTVDNGITKYVRTDALGAEEFADNRDKQAYRIWESASAPANLESTVWNDFLFGVRRWMADPGGDLRMTLDPIADLDMTRHYEEVGGWMREWYVYVPDGVTTSTQDVPVVFASHGYTLNGGVYAGQSDWHKVADAEKCIIIYPSAINGNISDNGNAPFPAWNLSQDPTRMDDIGFFEFMLADLDQTYDVDLGRVYATGHSWGSQMTHVLALSNPDMFAAVAPLSGFIFKDYVYDSLDEQAMTAAGGVPVYIAAGTEGGTEHAICPVPPTQANNSGKTLEKWFALNGCDGSIDWSTVGANWKNNSAYTQDGRWYTLTYEKDGVPMLRAEIVDYMPHATMPEHSARVWNDWFSHFSRNDAGVLTYTA